VLVEADASGVASALETLLADRARRDAMAGAARALVEQGRGALRRTLVLIHPYLD
jgi:3-deoxy-D-manno-octulosonic-acid transferase